MWYSWRNSIYNDGWSIIAKKLLMEDLLINSLNIKIYREKKKKNNACVQIYPLFFKKLSDFQERKGCIQISLLFYLCFKKYRLIIINLFIFK